MQLALITLEKRIITRPTSGSWAITKYPPIITRRPTIVGKYPPIAQVVKYAASTNEFHCAASLRGLSSLCRFVLQPCVDGWITSCDPRSLWSRSIVLFSGHVPCQTTLWFPEMQRCLHLLL